jgi:hypothetical protein
MAAAIKESHTKSKPPHELLRFAGRLCLGFNQFCRYKFIGYLWLECETIRFS